MQLEECFVICAHRGLAARYFPPLVLGQICLVSVLYDLENTLEKPLVKFKIAVNLLWVILDTPLHVVLHHLEQGLMLRFEHSVALMPLKASEQQWHLQVIVRLRALRVLVKVDVK